MPEPPRRAWHNPELRAMAFILVSTLAIGTVMYQVLEGWTTLDALYFSVVTLATVGYGDLTPKTDAGKLFTIAYIIVGIGILAAFANALAKDWLDRRLRRAGLAAVTPEAGRPVAAMRRRLRTRRPVVRRRWTGRS